MHCFYCRKRGHILIFVRLPYQLRANRSSGYVVELDSQTLIDWIARNFNRSSYSQMSDCIQIADDCRPPVFQQKRGRRYLRYNPAADADRERP